MVHDAGDLPESAKETLLELVKQAEEKVANTTETPLDPKETWSSTVEEMEASHPEATAFMNRVATSLANMGI